MIGTGGQDDVNRLWNSLEAYNPTQNSVSMTVGATLGSPSAPTATNRDGGEPERLSPLKVFALHRAL